MLQLLVRVLVESWSSEARLCAQVRIICCSYCLGLVKVGYLRRVLGGRCVAHASIQSYALS
jgi:hypothetical protein